MKKIIVAFSFCIVTVSAQAQVNTNGVNSQQPYNGNTQPAQRMDNANQAQPGTAIGQPGTINSNVNNQRNTIDINTTPNNSLPSTTINNNLNNTTTTTAPVTNSPANSINGAGNSNMNTNSLPSNGRNDNNGTSSNTLNSSNSNYQR